MAIKRYGQKLFGLSSDTKPTTRVQNGTEFVETDSKKVAIYVSGTWYYIYNQAQTS